MKSLILIASMTLLVVLGTACNTQEDQTITTPVAHTHEPISELKLQTLMKETLAGAEDLEIVMSKVEVPPNTSLPLHFHPGEEFAYILEGAGTMYLEGQEKITIRAGEVGMVPFKHHHSFTALEEGCKILVFRVHEKGQPERTLIN